MAANLASLSLGKNKPNQDSLLALDLGDGRAVIAVADGVGGRPSGEIASKIAVETVKAVLKLDFAVRLEALFTVIAQHIQDEAAAHGALATTLTLARVDGDVFHIGHAGDTRAYLLSGDTVSLITRDHNLARLMIEEDGMRPAEALSFPNATALVSCIGADVEMTVDAEFGVAQPGDRMLIVSDGVHAIVPHEVLAELNAAADDAAGLIEALRAYVEQIGIVDDTTAVAWEFA